ncbi:exocyst complex component exo84b, partial [Quercus suber]
GFRIDPTGAESCAALLFLLLRHLSHLSFFAFLPDIFFLNSIFTLGSTTQSFRVYIYFPPILDLILSVIQIEKRERERERERENVFGEDGAAERLVGDASKENGAKVEEGLSVFKSDKFDADSFVQSRCSLNEKELKQLCSNLMDLKKASAEEMRRSVYANYAAFIRTSKEISDLEGELSSIRNLLSTQAALIHGLAEGVHIDSLSTSVSEGSTVNDLLISEGREPSELEKWLIEFPDLLDVLLAERRVDEALAALDEGERVASEAKKKKTLTPAVLMSLQASIVERRQKLADQLAEAACQPSTRGGELRAAISALKKLGDGPRAHSLLLNAHLQRYQCNMQSLRPSSTSYGGAYTAALCQLVFSAIAQAASDSSGIFGKEPAYSSELF